MLNAKQQKIVWAGVVILCLMALYVPWKATLHTPSTNIEDAAGYALIFSPPKFGVPWGVHVDVARLLPPMGVVVLATMAGVAMAKGGQP